MTVREVVLSYESGRWRARAPGIDLVDAELAALDRRIVAAVASAPSATTVHVRFDRDSLPSWTRQYHAHYCNYVLHVAAPLEP